MNRIYSRVEKSYLKIALFYLQKNEWTFIMIIVKIMLIISNIFKSWYILNLLKIVNISTGGNLERR